jgi:glycine cleavage system H protein
MNIPDDRKYLESHEWVKLDGHVATIGITQLAADQLSDVTFVELPGAGSPLSAGQVFGEIESVKATSELYSALSGTVTEINEALADQPELVNSAPFEGGWMIKLEATNLAEIEGLLSAADYAARFASA